MTVRTVEIQAETKKMATISKTKEHIIVTDEPKQIGGDNTGANPLEVLLASLAGCENATAVMVAKKLDLELEKLTFRMKGTYDTKGIKGDPDVSAYFQKLEINVQVYGSLKDQQIEILKEEVHKRCPVYTLIEAAGVDIYSEWVQS